MKRGMCVRPVRSVLPARADEHVLCPVAIRMHSQSARPQPGSHSPRGRFHYGRHEWCLPRFHALHRSTVRESCAKQKMLLLHRGDTIQSELVCFLLQKKREWEMNVLQNTLKAHWEVVLKAAEKRKSRRITEAVEWVRQLDNNGKQKLKKKKKKRLDVIE